MAMSYGQWSLPASELQVLEPVQRNRLTLGATEPQLDVEPVTSDSRKLGCCVTEYELAATTN